MLISNQLMLRRIAAAGAALVVGAVTVASAQDAASPAGGAGETTFLARHLEVQQVEQVTRFNYMDRGRSTVTDRDVQYRVRARVEVDVTGSGNTLLRVRAETGRGFDNSWDNTGLGRGEGRWTFNVKSFALGQKLGSHVELQAGGIEYEQGAGTQRTYASGDGHLVGYRVKVTGAVGSWQPDLVSLTTGYVGDFDEPNVFSRFHMGKANYVQALVQKKLGREAEVSAEVNSIRDIWFTRQAVRWRTVWRPLVDEVTVEAVTRASDDPCFGWSAAVSRALDEHSRWRASVIYNHVPQALYDKDGSPILLNQGEMDVGRRIAVGSTYVLDENLEVGVFGGRLLDNTPSKRWIAQVFASYQYAHLITRLLR